MLKRIDYFFFEDQGTIKDRLYFYGSIGILLFISIMSLVVAKL